jgi:hypothetical protein
VGISQAANQWTARPSPVMALRNTSTTLGSNWLAEQRFISATAASNGSAFL